MTPHHRTDHLLAEGLESATSELDPTDDAATAKSAPGTDRSYTDQALAAAKEIAEDDERAILLADLETIPGQPRYW